MDPTIAVSIAYKFCKDRDFKDEMIFFGGENILDSINEIHWLQWNERLPDLCKLTFGE
jgi:hypothetical protein